MSSQACSGLTSDQTERGNHKGLLSACFDPSPMMDFIVPHCPGFRQVEQSLGACRGESSQALAKLIRRQPPRPKLSKTEPHKPRKMGKFRRIRSTPYTLPLSLCSILEESGQRRWTRSTFALCASSEQTKLFACIYSECNGPALVGVDLAGKCQTRSQPAAGLLATHGLQRIFL